LIAKFATKNALIKSAYFGRIQYHRYKKDIALCVENDVHITFVETRML